MPPWRPEHRRTVEPRIRNARREVMSNPEDDSLRGWDICAHDGPHESTYSIGVMFRNPKDHRRVAIRERNRRHRERLATNKKEI